MRWNKKEAEVGSIKTETRFAWLPTQLTDPKDNVVWLEFYKVDLRYDAMYVGNEYKWVFVRRYIPSKGSTD